MHTPFSDHKKSENIFRKSIIVLNPVHSSWEGGFHAITGFSPENLRGGKNCSSISKIYEHFMAFVLFSTGK